MSLTHHHADSSVVPSFVDLRRFAASSMGFDHVGSDAYTVNRRLLDLPADTVTVGVIRLPRGSGAVEGLPGDEFVICCDGGVHFDHAAAAMELAQDESAVIPRGSAFSWSTQAPATLIFMRHAHDSAGGGPIVPIDEQAQLQPSGPPLAELLLTPTPECRNFTDYRSADGTFTCGTWDSTPYTRHAMAYRHYELMHLLSGTVSFEDETGLVGSFAQGDIFLIQRHAKCSWNSQVDVKKVYAIHRPV